MRTTPYAGPCVPALNFTDEYGQIDLLSLLAYVYCACLCSHPSHSSTLRGCDLEGGVLRCQGDNMCVTYGQPTLPHLAHPNRRIQNVYSAAALKINPSALTHDDGSKRKLGHETNHTPRRMANEITEAHKVLSSDGGRHRGCAWIEGEG